MESIRRPGQGQNGLMKVASSKWVEKAYFARIGGAGFLLDGEGLPRAVEFHFQEGLNLEAGYRLNTVMVVHRPCTM